MLAIDDNVSWTTIWLIGVAVMGLWVASWLWARRKG